MYTDLDEFKQLALTNALAYNIEVKFTDKKVTTGITLLANTDKSTSLQHHSLMFWYKKVITTGVA